MKTKFIIDFENRNLEVKFKMEIETIEQKREYLENNINDINTVVGGVLGCKINFKIREEKNGTFWLEDNYNFKNQVGIMKIAFRVVNVQTFGFWWKDNGFACDLQFAYEHCGGGTNGANFAYLEVIDNFVSINIKQ